MKPQKTLLFLLCAIAFVIGSHFLLRSMGYEGLPAYDGPGTDRICRENAPDRAGGKDARENMANRWLADSLIQLYQKIYRPQDKHFRNPLLDHLPLEAFQYDTAGAGQHLLQGFLARLLSLDNPQEALWIDALYQTPDLWSEDPGRERPAFSRILHYGDGFIQNDIISLSLRELFQKDFGGHGPGLVALFSQEGMPTPVRRQGPWHVVDASGSGRRGNYGIWNAYLAPPPITALLGSGKEEGSLVFPVPENIRATQGRIFMELLVHEDVQKRDIVAEADGMALPSAPERKVFGQQRLTYALPATFHQVELRMQLLKNRSLYALSLNDTTGICVDNLSLGGKRAGQAFTANNRRFLTDQFRLLDVGLLLYQCGTEAWEHAQGEDFDDEAFRLRTLRELSYLRTLMPSLPVIVIGLPDLPNREGKPDPAGIRQILKECALQTACVYWDLYSAMGGEGSATRWITASVPLATDMPFRFTPQGGDLAGRLFYKAIMDAYRQFLRSEGRDMILNRAKTLELTERRIP